MGSCRWRSVSTMPVASPSMERVETGPPSCEGAMVLSPKPPEPSPTNRLKTPSRVLEEVGRTVAVGLAQARRALLERDLHGLGEARDEAGFAPREAPRRGAARDGVEPGRVEDAVAVDVVQVDELPRKLARKRLAPRCRP